MGFCAVTSARMRKHDVFGRIGGEEFACLLSDADAATATLVAERIRREFAESDLLGPGRLSVSIGIATSSQAGHELYRLLSLADKALYEAKNQGRNRVEHYHSAIPTRPARGS